MRYYLVVLLLFISFIFVGQNTTSAVSEKILEKTFSDYEIKQMTPRKMLSIKNGKGIAKFNPINYIAGGLLFFYQNILSEQIQADCSYEISCSSYTKLCISRYGFIIGTLKGIHQLNNCFPSAIDDYPVFKMSNNLKIRNQIEPD